MRGIANGKRDFYHTRDYIDLRPRVIAGPELAERVGMTYAQVKALADRGIAKPQEFGRQGRGCSSQWLETDIGVLRAYRQLLDAGAPADLAARAVPFLQAADPSIFQPGRFIVVGADFGPLLTSRHQVGQLVAVAGEACFVVHLGQEAAA